MKPEHKKIMNNFLKFFFVCCAVLLFNAPGFCQGRKKVSNWSNDLDLLVRQLDNEHPKLKCGPDRISFDSMALRLKKRINGLSRTEVIMELSKLVASLHDGHTQIALRRDSAVAFHRLPVNLYWFIDGIYVRSVDKKYEKYAGAKVTRIGGLSIEDAIKKLRVYIHGGNEMAIHDILPSRLVIPEVLQTIGAIKEMGNVSVELQDSSGTIFQVLFPSLPMNSALDLVSAAGSGTRPMYLQKTGDNYWFKYIDSLQLMYCQFNAVQEKESEGFEDFCKRLSLTMDTLDAHFFILDIRNNNGGDNTLNKYLMRALMRNDKISRQGHFYTIIGRLTFSAAMNLASDVERLCNVIFAGEPTGAAPNHYGETKSVVLPVSGITVLYSSQYWQGGDPRDKRDAIEPSLGVPLTINDYRQNNDPVLNAIIKQIHLLKN
ncbi:MAG: peptidase [Chitinophagaceae bacterium]|nr:peptidase [Chitinophagaceae bacterium]